MRVVSAIAERVGLSSQVQSVPRPASSLQSFAQTAGIAVAATGIVALLGWAVGIRPLTSISSEYVSMKPNTAFAFVLAGGSLYLLSAREPDRYLRLAAVAASFVVAVIGVLTLSEYLYGWDLDIDQLVFSESATSIGTSSPGRMAPASALNLFLIGVSLLVLDSRRCYPVAQILTLVAALISLTALIGYAYGVESLYGMGSTTEMAIHSSLCFLALSAGVLLTRQEHGLLVVVTSDAAGGVMARRLLPAAIIIPLALGWLTVVGQQDRHPRPRVQRLPHRDLEHHQLRYPHLVELRLPLPARPRPAARGGSRGKGPRAARRGPTNGPRRQHRMGYRH